MKSVLLEQPELGISPEAQGILADFLFDRTHRANYFPHIKTLVFATHSTVFLDRNHITNNYTVEKSGDAISRSDLERSDKSFHCGKGLRASPHFHAYLRLLSAWKLRRSLRQ
jgi:hypothetical protein